MRRGKTFLQCLLVCMLGLGSGMGVAACGMFSEDVRSTVVGVGVDAAVKAMQKAIGNAADTSPTVCEVENNAGDAQLLVLCTVCYGKDTSACAGKAD